MAPRLLLAGVLLVLGGSAWWWWQRPPPPVPPAPVVAPVPAVTLPTTVTPPAAVTPPVPAKKPTTAQVVVGPIDEECLARLTAGRSSFIRREGSKENLKVWCGILVAEPLATTLREALIVDLGRLSPDLSILLTPMPTTATGTGCLVEIGSRVPASVTRSVLLTLRVKVEPLLVAAATTGGSAITIAVPRPDVGEPLTEAQWTQLATRPTQSLSLPSSRPAVVEPTSLPAGPLAEVDFRQGAVPGRWEGVTWTPDGVRLLGAPLPRRPPNFPKQEEFAAPDSPYRAEVPIPGVAAGRRAVTVTLVVAPAALGGTQDHVFSLGLRSRWLGLQVDAQGGLRLTADNGWRLAPALGAPAATLPPLVAGTWQVLTVSVDEDAATGLLVVGDQVAPSLAFPPRTARGPQRVEGPSEEVLTFAHPVNGHHLHGQVAQIVVQRGQRTAAEVLALHARLSAQLPAALDLAQFPLAPPPAVTVEVPEDLRPDPKAAARF